MAYDAHSLTSICLSIVYNALVHAGTFTLAYEANYNRSACLQNIMCVLLYGVHCVEPISLNVK